MNHFISAPFSGFPFIRFFLDRKKTEYMKHMNYSKREIYSIIVHHILTSTAHCFVMSFLLSSNLQRLSFSYLLRPYPNTIIKRRRRRKGENLKKNNQPIYFLFHLLFIVSFSQQSPIFLTSGIRKGMSDT